MKKFRPNEDILDEENDDMKISDEQILDSSISDDVSEVEPLENYDKDALTIEHVDNSVATRDGSKKNRMQYATFYAEEVGAERDDATDRNKTYR